MSKPQAWVSEHAAGHSVGLGMIAFCGGGCGVVDDSETRQDFVFPLTNTGRV